jgi:hypothetical protein
MGVREPDGLKKDDVGGSDAFLRVCGEAGFDAGLLTAGLRWLDSI